MEENKQQIEEAAIDFGAIWQAIKKYKKLYCWTLGIAFVVATIIGFSLPKTYNCQILLAPETGGGSSSLGGLASLASSFGFSVGGGSQGGDAITPSVYPDLMKQVEKTCSYVIPEVAHEGD